MISHTQNKAFPLVLWFSKRKGTCQSCVTHLVIGLCKTHVGHNFTCFFSHFLSSSPFLSHSPWDDSCHLYSYYYLLPQPTHWFHKVLTCKFTESKKGLQFLTVQEKGDKWKPFWLHLWIRIFNKSDCCKSLWFCLFCMLASDTLTNKVCDMSQCLHLSAPPSPPHTYTHKNRCICTNLD